MSSEVSGEKGPGPNLCLTSFPGCHVISQADGCDMYLQTCGHTAGPFVPTTLKVSPATSCKMPGGEAGKATVNYT